MSDRDSNPGQLPARAAPTPAASTAKTSPLASNIRGWRGAEGAGDFLGLEEDLRASSGAAADAPKFIPSPWQSAASAATVSDPADADAQSKSWLLELDDERASRPGHAPIVPEALPSAPPAMPRPLETSYADAEPVVRRTGRWIFVGLVGAASIALCATIVKTFQARHSGSSVVENDLTPASSPATASRSAATNSSDLASPSDAAHRAPGRTSIGSKTGATKSAPTRAPASLPTNVAPNPAGSPVDRGSLGANGSPVGPGTPERGESRTTSTSSGQASSSAPEPSSAAPLESDPNAHHAPAAGASSEPSISENQLTGSTSTPPAGSSDAPPVVTSTETNTTSSIGTTPSTGTNPDASASPAVLPTAPIVAAATPSSSAPDSAPIDGTDALPTWWPGALSTQPISPRTTDAAIADGATGSRLDTGLAATAGGRERVSRWLLLHSGAAAPLADVNVYLAPQSMPAADGSRGSIQDDPAVLASVFRDPRSTRTTNNAAENAPENAQPGHVRPISGKVDVAGVWEGNTVPMSAIGDALRILTPGVGFVRIVLKSGPVFEGRLFAVGQGRLWIDNELGRQALIGDRIDKVEQVSGPSPSPSPAPSAGSAAPQRVRVKTPGGIFFGTVVARDERTVTLVTDDGSRVTVESTAVEPAPLNGPAGEGSRESKPDKATEKPKPAPKGPDKGEDRPPLGTVHGG